jgi:hypothetical protein
MIYDGVPREARACDMPGPIVKVSAMYEKQVRCNRTSGHTGPHQLRDLETFGIRAEWVRAYESRGDQRSRIVDP